MHPSEVEKWYVSINKGNKITISSDRTHSNPSVRIEVKLEDISKKEFDMLFSNDAVTVKMKVMELLYAQCSDGRLNDGST